MHPCLHQPRGPALPYIHAQLFTRADAFFPTPEQGAEPSVAACQDEK